ncbi:MAG: hypothetical protein ABSE93_05190 [Terriglobia bacterium]
MWDKLRKQVTVEQQQLHRLLETYRPLIEKCAVSPPDDIELSAVAAMLHSFYNGFESSLGRQPPPRSPHRRLPGLERSRPIPEVVRPVIARPQSVAQGPHSGPFARLRACPERSEWGRLCGFSSGAGCCRAAVALTPQGGVSRSGAHEKCRPRRAGSALHLLGRAPKTTARWKSRKAGERALRYIISCLFSYPSRLTTCS